jgi:hypothetical protein
MQNNAEENYLTKTQQLIEKYNKVLVTKRNEYDNQFKSSPLFSLQEDKALDAVFILDCMLARNKRVINYITCMQRHQQSIPAINSMLKSVFDEIEINRLVQVIVGKIDTEGNLITQGIKADYESLNASIKNWESALVFLSLALVGLGLGLILSTHLFGFVCFFLGFLVKEFKVFAPFFGRSFDSVPEETIRELEHLNEDIRVGLFKLANPGVSPDLETQARLLIFQKDYWKDCTAKSNDMVVGETEHSKTTPRQMVISKQNSPALLVESFFKFKFSEQSTPLSEEVVEEYKRINAVTCS